MKLHAMALSALLLVPIVPASAQVTNSPGDASKRIYDWCMKRPDGMPGECGCVAGFYAGATEDDAFRLVARLVEHLTPIGVISDQASMIAALREEATGQSISGERFSEILESFGSFDMLGVKSDSICVPLRGGIQALATE